MNAAGAFNNRITFVLYRQSSELQPCQTCIVNYVQAKEAQGRPESCECVTVFTVAAARSEDRKRCFAGSWYLRSVSSVPALGSRKRPNRIQTHHWQEVGHRSMTKCKFCENDGDAELICPTGWGESLEWAKSYEEALSKMVKR